MTKITIKEVIHYIGIVFLMLFLVYGLLYITRGNEITSFMFGIPIGGAFFALVYFLLLEKDKTSRGKFRSTELVYLGLYIALSVLVTPILFHFIETEFVLKNQIKDLGNEKLNHLERMVTEYEKAASRDTALIGTTITANLSAYFNLPPKDRTNRTKYENKLQNAPYNLNFSGNVSLSDSDLRQRLLIQRPLATSARFKALISGINELKEKNETFIQNARTVINDWSRLKLNRVLYEADVRLTENLQQLQTRKPDFDYQIPSKNIPLDNPKALFENYKSSLLLPLVIILILHLLILWPYIFVETQGKKYNTKAKTTGIEI